jgi:phage host-nuclease inhibitor protein Gam
VRILCIAAVAVLLLSACGGGGGGGSSSSGTQLSAAAYRAKLAKVKVEAASAQAHVGQGLQAKTVGDLTKTVDRFAADTQRIGDEIAQLNPPQDAAAANTELAQGFQDIAAATRDASAKVAKLKTAQAGISYLEHASGPIRAGRKVDDALAKLKKLGYTTGS